MLENAVRICGAKFGTLHRFDGAAFHWAASFGTPPAMVEFQTKRGPFLPEAGNGFHRMMQTKQVTHVADATTETHPGVAARLGGARSMAHVPMLKDDELVGAILIYRQEILPFTDKQIAMVKNFAAQAVIAIENARLLNELRQRTDDLTESLEQQTATSEVLQVISRSPGELEPVFQAILGNATRICEAKFGFLWLLDGEKFRAVALHGVPPALANSRQRDPTMAASPKTVIGRALRSKSIVHVHDLTTDPAYIEKYPPMVELVQVGGARTLLVVPVLKDNDEVGAISIYRQEVRPFTDKQIELVKNFAAQAVIAIENTRLLSELRESLQRQIATSDVLSVISSSPGELGPVFNTMLESATRICDAKFGSLVLFEGNNYRRVELYNAPTAYIEAMAQNPVMPLSAALHLRRLIDCKQVLHINDILTEDPDTGLAKLGGARTIIAVPMLKESEVIGAISVFRQEVQPFTEKQIELVTTFAAQAVIAIENTRLLNELRQRTDDLSESLEQQTATSEVLKVISSSPGELEAVFQAMLANAARVCGARIRQPVAV